MTLAAKALSMFRSGLNTVQIAGHLGISEAKVSSLIHEERCRTHSLDIHTERPRLGALQRCGDNFSGPSSAET